MNLNVDFEITDDKRIAYLRISTYARNKQNKLIPQGQTQNLTWTVVCIVAEASWSERTIFITDVCHATTALKSTTLKCINRLVKEKVLVRKSDKKDKRRKALSISPKFRPVLQSYIDDIITRFSLGNIIEQIGKGATLNLSQAENLLSSLKNSKIPLMIHAEDGEILMISKEWERLTGYTHREIPTIEKWTEMAYAASNTISKNRKIISSLYEIFDKKEEGTFIVHKKDGEAMKWSFQSNPLGKLSDGRANIITIATNVT